MNYNNYIITVRSQASNTEGGTTLERLFYKDGNYVCINSTYTNIFSDSEGFPIGRKEKQYIIAGNNYRYEYTATGKIINYGAGQSFNIDNFKTIGTYASYRENADYIGMLLINPLKTAITAKIKTVNFDGIDCYSIEVKDNNTDQNIILYFEKETGLLRKCIDQEYYYSFNTVSDDIFKLPDEKDVIEPTDDTYIINSFNKEID